MQWLEDAGVKESSTRYHFYVGINLSMYHISETAPESSFSATLYRQKYLPNYCLAPLKISGNTAASRESNPLAAILL